MLAPFTGVLVDRWDRRLTMLWTDVLHMVLVFLFVLLVLLVNNPGWLLTSCLVILLLCACGSQFFTPARTAVITDLVPPEQRPMAFGSYQQISYFAQILGPALALPLYVALGPEWAFLLNALSYLISFALILPLHVPPYHPSTEQQQGFWTELVEGLRFFLGNQVLVTLLGSGMIFMFADMAYNSQEYLYGVENLHIASVWLGVYVASLGVGIVAGLPLIAALARRFSEVQILWICLILNGVALLVLSRVTTMIPGMICVLMLGVTNASVFVTVRPLTVRVTPRNLIGRVMAVEVPLINLSSLVGGGLAGTVASTVLLHFHLRIAGMSFGRLDTLFIALGLLTICSGIFARLALYPAVKRLDAAETLAHTTSDRKEVQGEA